MKARPASWEEVPNQNKKSRPSAGSGPCAPVAWVARGKGAELGAGRGGGEGKVYVLPAQGLALMPRRSSG